MKAIAKVLLGVLATVFFLLIAALVLPFLIDLNRFKPEIQRAVAEKMNAKIDFTSARLTILTGLGVRLQNVVLENTDAQFGGTKTFSVKELDVHAELRPLLEKRLVGVVLLKSPDIVFATRRLKNNLAALARENPQDPAAPPASAQNDAPPPPPATASERAATDDLLRRVVIKEVRVEKAQFTLQELQSDGTVRAPVKITDLAVLVTNIGVDKDVKVVVSTSVDVRKDGNSVRGPIRFDAATRVKTSGTAWTQAAIKGDLILDGLAIDAKGAFVKAAGIPLNVEFDAALTPTTADIPRLDFRLHTLVAKVVAKINDLKTLSSAITIKVDENNLASLGDVLPQHKALLPGARIYLSAGVHGPLSLPMQVKAGMDLAVKLGDSDISIKGDLTGISPPAGEVSIKSQNFNVSQVLGPFLPPKKTGENSSDAASGHAEKDAANKKQGLASEGEPTSGNGAVAAPAEEFALTPEQKKMLEGADVSFKMNFARIVKDEVEVKPFLLDARLKGLAAELRDLSLGIFGGGVSLRGSADLSQKPLPFTGSAKLNGVEIERIVALVAAAHKDLLHGKINMELAAAGRGTTIASLTQNLDGKGMFQFLDGELNTASVARTAQQQLDGFIGGLSIVESAGAIFDAAEKVLANPLVQKLGVKPGFDIKQIRAQYEALKNVKVADKASVDRSLKNVKGTVEIKAGKLHLITNKSAADGTVTFDGTVALDTSLGGGGVFTASDALKQKMLSQSKYSSLLFDEQGGFDFALGLSGKAAAPVVAVDWKPLKERFVRNARALVEKEVRKSADDAVNGALRGKADAALAELKKKQDELRKQGEAAAKAQEAELRKKADEAGKKAGDEVKKRGGDALKGLFGR